MDRRRAGQVLWRCASQLQQLREFKSVPSKVSVSLLKEVEGLGEAGSVVKVFSGFARNYLLPQRLATQLPSPTSLSRRQRLQVLSMAAQQQDADTSSSSRQAVAAEPEAVVVPQTETEIVMGKLKAPLVFKRKADGLKLAVPIGRDDLVEAVARQLRVTLVPDLLDIGTEELAEVGEFLLPLKIVKPDGGRVQLEVHIAST